MANLEIQRAFLDGVEEVFSIMFTDKLELSLLNEEDTNTNVYKESGNKLYYDPVVLIGKIVLNPSQSDIPVEVTHVDSVITIPTKQLITNNIPHIGEEDLKMLERATFKYEGITYTVSTVRPQTLVAGMWQLYSFYCMSSVLLSSIGGW